MDGKFHQSFGTLSFPENNLDFFGAYSLRGIDMDTKMLDAQDGFESLTVQTHFVTKFWSKHTILQIPMSILTRASNPTTPQTHVTNSLRKKFVFTTDPLTYFEWYQKFPIFLMDSLSHGLHPYSQWQPHILCSSTHRPLSCQTLASPGILHECHQYSELRWQMNCKKNVSQY